ncbi:hypothetical protein B484DRAFT_251251 [Ochromonadaceae sp. CCMP2298]|nr:hypothetical protein B484DRAFT_251251 [Ochromonadaceae sp. CCMP2298]
MQQALAVCEAAAQAATRKAQTQQGLGQGVGLGVGQGVVGRGALLRELVGAGHLLAGLPVGAVGAVGEGAEGAVGVETRGGAQGLSAPVRMPMVDSRLPGPLRIALEQLLMDLEYSDSAPAPASASAGSAAGSTAAGAISSSVAGSASVANGSVSASPSGAAELVQAFATLLATQYTLSPDLLPLLRELGLVSCCRFGLTPPSPLLEMHFVTELSLRFLQSQPQSAEQPFGPVGAQWCVLSKAWFDAWRLYVGQRQRPPSLSRSGSDTWASAGAGAGVDRAPRVPPRSTIGESLRNRVPCSCCADW